MNKLQIMLYVVLMIGTFFIGILCGIEWGYVKRDEEYEKFEREKNEDSKNIAFEKDWKF